MLTAVKNLREGMHQVAAVPLRLVAATRELEVLLITSRETRRWVIPKGWPVDGLQEWDAAAKEADEEAGVRGTIGEIALGRYAYFKRLDDHFRLLDVVVYPLWVRDRALTWKEHGQRDDIWLSADRASDLVQEPGLREILNRIAKSPATRGLVA